MLFQCAFLLLKFPKRLAVYVFLSNRKVDLSCLLSIAYKNGTKTSLVFLNLKCIIIVCNPSIKKLLKDQEEKQFSSWSFYYILEGENNDVLLFSNWWISFYGLNVLYNFNNNFKPFLQRNR